MGDIFKEFFDKASDVIREVGQSSLAFAALCVLVIGIVGVFQKINFADEKRRGDRARTAAEPRGA